MSHVFAGEDIGGAQLSPTQGLQLIEAITYHSGAAGWISMVHTCIGAMSAAFLPDTAIGRLFDGKTDNRFSGQGTPTGMLKKVDGGYRLNGKWAYASGIYHATYTHTAALLDDGNGHPAKDEKGNVIVLCAHAPVGEHELLGNWNSLGLQATGSIDYAANDVFIPDDMVFPILTAEPQRMKEFFSLGVVGLAAIGHSGWAIGAARRMLDEAAKYAKTKTGRAGMLGESDKFWFDFGRAEARVRAARALLFEVWRDVEASIEAGNRMTTRQISLVHLAKSEVHEGGVDACHFVYRALGGASLRYGVMQRIYREMLTAANHFTINPNIVAAAGRDIAGVWSDRVWQFYDLIEKK
ncbi:MULTISPECIES: acyl-CoA dehydrogenase family protein [unclassified Rhizobium]|nr:MULTISPECIES: acyl-CoA dehydrogenase family protein [unclassified Rhizobium]